MAGQPLNPILLEAGARLHTRARTATGYRMVRLEGMMPRPGLVDDGTGPPGGLDLEVWDVPLTLVQQLAVDVEAPLRIDAVRLANGSSVPAFVADPDAVTQAPDISAAGGWRAHLRASAS